MNIATTYRPLPTIDGAVEMDLPSVPAAQRRHEVALLTYLPPCTRLMVRVGRIGPWDEPDVVQFLAEAAVAKSLAVDVRADDAQVLGAWLDAVRDTVHQLLTGAPSSSARIRQGRGHGDPWGGGVS